MAASKKEHPFGICSGRNESGIPNVNFIEDVPAFMSQPGAELKKVMEALDALYNELKQLEGRFAQNRKVHEDMIPDIKENIAVVEFLKDKQESGSDEPTLASFMLSASIFAEAKLNPAKGRVILWLGAQTAAELAYDEAIDLLEKNLHKKEEQLKQCEQDFRFTREQITTVEVCMARVYNNDVKARRNANKEENES